jgi:hypothetical protein
MLRKLIYLAAVGVLVAVTTIVPAPALAANHGYYRQTYGHQDWRDARDFRIITEPKVQLQIQHRHYYPGYGYYVPYSYGYVAPSQPVWVPAAWQWNGYQWVWVPGYWSY